MKKDKCFVSPCKNHKHQGSFIGNVCVPCAILAEDIRCGKLKHSYNFSDGVVKFIADNWRQIIKECEL